MAKEPHQEKDADASVQWRWLREPGVFCDTFTVDVWRRSGVVRLTFGEFTEKDTTPFFRSAVVLPISDATSLRDILSELLEKAAKEEKEEKAEKK